MIGFVTPNLQALLRLKLTNLEAALEIDVVLDTGFNGLMTITSDVVESLRLEVIGDSQITLANGEEVRMSVFLVEVEWNGTKRQAPALLTEGDPLLGMSFLEGHQLTIEVRDGGAVNIETL